MRGTAFKSGQMADFTSIVSGAVGVALPRVAAKFRDPKAVLKGIKDKSEILASRLEVAIGGVIQSMLSLIRHPQRLVTISKTRDPDTYYQIRTGLYVWGNFRDRVVVNATPVEGGTVFKINEDELGEDMIDEKIENGLTKVNRFKDSDLCAVLGELIESGQLDKRLRYLLYAESCVVDVRWGGGVLGWDVDGWGRVSDAWSAGRRVLSPATVPSTL